MAWHGPNCWTLYFWENRCWILLGDEVLIGEFEIFWGSDKEDYSKKNDFKRLTNNGKVTVMLMNLIPYFFVTLYNKVTCQLVDICIGDRPCKIFECLYFSPYYSVSIMQVVKEKKMWFLLVLA